MSSRNRDAWLAIIGGWVTFVLSWCLVLTSGGCRQSHPEGGETQDEQRGSRLATTTSQQEIEWAEERARMVEHQIVARGVRDPDVLAAMRDVPRHWFVPKYQSRYAYADRPLPIGFDQTISQPFIVAMMTELLAVKPGEKVLEIGTGSGYQAAILAELTDAVFTIEIVEPLARRTIRLFEEKNLNTIQARIGDGYRGWPKEAPFDAIIVTCAPDHPPPALIEQLRVGGRMCIPVGPEGGIQQLVLFFKGDDGRLTRRRVTEVRFVPMTGEARGD